MIDRRRLNGVRRLDIVIGFPAGTIAGHSRV